MVTLAETQVYFSVAWRNASDVALYIYIDPQWQLRLWYSHMEPGYHYQRGRVPRVQAINYILLSAKTDLLLNFAARNSI